MLPAKQTRAQPKTATPVRDLHLDPPCYMSEGLGTGLSRSGVRFRTTPHNAPPPCPPHGGRHRLPHRCAPPEALYRSPKHRLLTPVEWCVGRRRWSSAPVRAHARGLPHPSVDATEAGHQSRCQRRLTSPPDPAAGPPAREVRHGTLDAR